MDVLLDKWMLSTPEQSGHIGEEVSSKEFETAGWVEAEIPGTLVGHLSEAGYYEDPYYGTNMKELPGYKTGKETHFAFHPMPKESPFRKPFWYRTTFSVDDDKSREQRFFVALDGLNYRANLWINGKRVESDNTLCGTYRRFNVEITRWVKRYKENVIAIELTAQKPDELGMTFIDWSPVPPDDSAGLWQPVRVYSTGQVDCRFPVITTKLEDDNKRAVLDFQCELINGPKEEFTGEVVLSLCGREIRRDISIAPWETTTVELNGEQIRELVIDNPDLWWPYDMGQPKLYDAKIAIVSKEGIVSCEKEFTFGIREITSEITVDGNRQFYINGVDTLIRGTAWSPDLMLKQSPRQDEIDISYLKEMHFNTVRLEGKLASDYFWELCDREGLLVLAGWPCCTHWEQWDKWKADDYVVAEESLRSQLLRLRQYASFAAWFYGSDFPPIPPVEKMYLKVLEECAPTLVHISSASQYESKVTGPSGVKMSGPYGYVPPRYWYHPDMPGFARSFNTETGPDSSFPRFESLKRMMPESELSVGSKSWNHHAGLASFLDTEVMNEALLKRYGADTNKLEEFLLIAQWNAFEAWRAMYEAYGREYPAGTGVIGWMMNGQWPSIIWQKYDWYNVPTGGFYGARSACEPIHGQYSYDDHSIWILNNSFDDIDGHVKVELYNAEASLIHDEQVSFSLAAREKGSFAGITPIAGVSFLFITVVNNNGTELSRNVYWLSGQQDEMQDFGTKKCWYYRPLTAWADFSALLSLENTTIEVNEFRKCDDDWKEFTIELTNTGKSIAFAGQLDLIDSEESIIAPAYWSENLVTLRPDENRTITAQVMNCDYKGEIRVRVNYINGEVNYL